MMAILFGGGDADHTRLQERSAEPISTLGDGMSTATLEFDKQSAVADRASELRVALGHWLTDQGIGEERAYDIVLATYEALANSVEHAYRGDSSGTVDLKVRYYPESGTVEVRVVDHGLWSSHISEPNRGRGVPLMRALADRVDVHSDRDGTTVLLVWDTPGP